MHRQNFVALRGQLFCVCEAAIKAGKVMTLLRSAEDAPSGSSLPYVSMFNGLQSCFLSN